MTTYPWESFYRATIRQSISKTQSVPFSLKLSKLPKLSTWLLTISPNTAEEEIVYYTTPDVTTTSVTVTIRGINPSSQSLDTSGTDYNNPTYQMLHSQNDEIRCDITHLHVIQEYGSLQSQIDGKVNKAWGDLRTWFATNSHVKLNLATWAEEVKSVTTWTSIVSADKFRIEKASGNFEDTPYSVLEGTISPWVAYIAWENIALYDLVIDEFIPKPSYIAEASTVTTATTWNRHEKVSIWNLAIHNRRSVSLIGNGVSWSSIKIMLDKVGTPTDSFQVRLETDSAWVPSGTLVHANASWSILGSSVTTSMAETTINWAWSFTVADWTLCHLVLSRSTAFDGSNYYRVGYFRMSNRSYLNNSYNASWGSANAIPTTSTLSAVLCLSCANVHESVVVKNTTTIHKPISYIRSALFARNKWESIKTSSIWGDFKIPWLTPNTPYYVHPSTPWSVSTTSWTTYVWFANWLWELVRDIWVTTSWALTSASSSFSSSLSFIVSTYAPCVMSWNVAWGASNIYAYIHKNWVVLPPSTNTNMIPWDIISINALWGTSPTYTITSNYPTIIAI